MENEHIQDISVFMKELENETDRGLPLVGTALIDEKLKNTLIAFFVDRKSSKDLVDEHSLIGSFSSRIDLCYALGLISEYEYSEINLLRKIRNEFAHAKHGISFKTEPIRGLCSSLKSDLPQGEDYPLKDPRFRCSNAIICIVLNLYYRPEWVQKEKRAPKEWGVTGHRWVSVKDRKPPKGVPVVVMVKKKVT